jgi:hypothetical protein
MTNLAELYHPFVLERHRVWERRLAGLPAPWYSDPVLKTKKFTNVFRVLDAGSQFLVGELLRTTDNPANVLMRCFLYRYTNRPEPWIAFQQEFGWYPMIDDLESGELLRFWRAYQAAGNPIFSPAYQMFVGHENKGMNRLDWAVRQGSLITPDFADEFFKRETMAERAAWLQTLPRCKDFMSMQILTDVGYSRHGAGQDENAFIIPGPGARAGVKAYVGAGYDPVGIIEEQADWWARQGTVTLFGRPPSLMDVQNSFCEYSKYVRAYRAVEVAGPERFGHYQGHGDLPWPVLPAHWGLDV